MTRSEGENILVTSTADGYELIDSGEGEKLERWGEVVLARPDPQALWPKNLSGEEWASRADARFVRDERDGIWQWRNADKKKTSWPVSFAGLKFEIKPTAFKHTGLFPEQAANWSWMRDVVSGAEPKILNLFGYTGGATLSCSLAGAKVVHVDSSKSAITWAKKNAELSGLSDKEIRWILDDVRVFVGREIKRGNKYDGIIMDPPAFGHGAKKEVWKIEEDFLELLNDCLELLSDKPIFFLINGYSAGYSSIAYKNNLARLVTKYGGRLEAGELAIEESGQVGSPIRLLPTGIFARWSV